MSSLIDWNRDRRQNIAARRDAIIREHADATLVPFSSYPLVDLRARLTEAVRKATGIAGLNPQFNLIDRQQFGGDVAITVNELLREGGAKNYAKNHVPAIAEALRDPALAPILERVESKGIYVNVSLTDRFLMEGVAAVLDLGSGFGLSDLQADRVFVVDYSSPNIAKQLHAGHIRSTIIGHVLCNLHEACGGLVYRVNHVNDFGGFGFILEGYRRWRDRLSDLPPNDRLLRLYAIRRTLERAAAAQSMQSLAPEDRELISDFLNVDSLQEVKDRYAEFLAASDAAFERLEEGHPEEVELWKEMVRWSLADFQAFYDALDVHIDFIIGESFYAEAGNEVVDRALDSGHAVLFTPELAAEAEREVAKLLAEGKIAEAEYKAMVGLIEKDIGAVVVALPDNERLVVRRSDGRSVYATRDLGAIGVRRSLFDPTDILYVVGQEQRVHFHRVFKSAEVIGLAPPDELNLKHIYFGFYIDARTKKKLSSRESASNVYMLLRLAIEHFSRKYEGDESWSKEDVDQAARQLAVGSLVFNDLKKDMKGAVEIETDDLQSTIEGFEKSGGAYVVYTACRARSILRKHSGELPRAEELSEFELSAQERWLILQIQQIPDKVFEAADKDDPSVLIRHLLDLAATYNSYYASSPVLKSGEVRQHRLLITAAVRQAFENALRICHIDCPEKI